jgi:hypothetical protein
MMGLCITVNKKRAFFNSAEDLYANAICVLSKDRLMLTFIGIANIVSKT